MVGGNAAARLRGKARVAVTGSRIGQAALARRDRRALIELIVRAGFVDLEWYEAATGYACASPERAVEHYLDGEGWIPLSPLLAAGVLPGLDRGDPSNDAMVRYLLRGNLGYLPTPVFDDVAYASQHAEAAEHPGRARGHFLGSATAQTALPVSDSWSGEVPTFGPWRAQMIKFGSLLAARERERAQLLAATAMPVGVESSATELVAELPADPATEAAYAKFVTHSAQLIDWNALDAGLSARDPERISILIPTIDDWKLTDVAVAALLRNCGNHDIEIVVVDNGSNPGAAIGLAQSLVGRDPTLTRVRPIWQPQNLNFALGTNLAFAASIGARIVLLNNDTEVCPGWLDPLLRELDDPGVVGVQPLLLYGDGTVQTAGTGFPDCGGLPSHLLVGHPAEDARWLGNFDVSAVTAAALAMRATDYCWLRGLDPRFINGFEDVDLCLRAVHESGARFRVATDSAVIHFESRTRARTVTATNRQILWSTWRHCLPRPDMAEILGAAGFEVVRWDPGVIGNAGSGRIPLPVIVRSPRTVPVGGGGARSPSLRWAIKAPVEFTIDVVDRSKASDTAGAIRGVDRTGHRAELARRRVQQVVASLTEAMRELGQEVVVDCREAHQRATAGLDDVVLVLADSDQFEPQPGRPNLLWFWDTPAARDDTAVAGAAGRDQYDQFGFDVILDRPTTELTTDAAWRALAETFLAAALAWRSDNAA